MRINFTRWCIVSCLIFFSFSVQSEPFRKFNEEEQAACAAELAAIDAAYDEYIVYLCDLERSFAEEMEQTLNLHCSERGGIMHGKIEQLNLGFHADRRATVAEARALHLMILDKYVEAINQNEFLRPFLETYPFPREQVRLFLTFRGINGEHADGSVRRVWNVYAYPEEYGAPREHRLLYYSKDPSTMDIVDLLREPYEEAVRQNALAPIANPGVHPVTAKEEAIDQLFLHFREQMYNKHELKCSSIGGAMQEGIESVGARFVAFRQVTQEEARQLIVDIAQSLVVAVNKQPDLRPYFCEDDFFADRLRLRLCFKNKKYGTHKNGSMESVVLEDGQITYFQIKPRKKGEVLLTIPTEVPVYAQESYQEALEIMERTPNKESWSHKIVSVCLSHLRGLLRKG